MIIENFFSPKIHLFRLTTDILFPFLHCLPANKDHKNPVEYPPS